MWDETAVCRPAIAGGEAWASCRRRWRCCAAVPLWSLALVRILGGRTVGLDPVDRVARRSTWTELVPEHGHRHVGNLDAAGRAFPVFC